MTDETGGWWHGFFDATYAEFGLRRHDEDVGAAIAFIVDKLQLGLGDTIFDQCCGIGRLSLPLAHRGLRVIGLDLEPTYTAAAEAAARAAELPCTFVTGDAFETAAPEPCDAAINWFTSCGYHEEDAVNRRMFERAFESLRPGGRYAVDFVQIARILNQYQPAIVERFDLPEGELTVVMEHTHDLRRGMIVARWTELHPDGRRVVRELENRLWLPHELVRLLEGCGFVELALYGSTDGEPLRLGSRRCIVVGRRPG